MITRRWGFPRLFGVAPAYYDNLAGLVRTVSVNNIVHTIPIARPGGVYRPNCAPHYLHVPEANRGLQNHVERFATLPFTPPPPRLEMDPSDPSTWQRPYRFT